MKSFYLFILSFFGLFVIFPPYSNNIIKVFASLYVSNDFMGLFMVPLHFTTVLHHSVSLVFLLYSWSIDFNTNKTAQNILIYTWLSSLNFGVNLYLGLRKIKQVEWLRHVSKHIYLITFIVNIVYQVIHAKNPFYWCLLTFIIIDDLYLLHWLYK